MDSKTLDVELSPEGVSTQGLLKDLGRTSTRKFSILSSLVVPDWTVGSTVLKMWLGAL